MSYKNSKAFTLAETMIVLVILGIIASITVPAVVRRQMEANNRARIKKSMTVYDTGINKFIIENQLKSDEAVYQIAPKGDCRITSQYFKVAENIEENGNKNLCKFKSADGVWWDISDILNPMIALKKDELGTDAETSFQLSAKFDQNGSLRVDDLAYEINLNSNDLESLQKIYAFINADKDKENSIDPTRTCSDNTKNANGQYYYCQRYINGTSALQHYAYDDHGYTLTYLSNCIDQSKGIGCTDSYIVRLNYDENGVIRYENNGHYWWHDCGGSTNFDDCERGTDKYTLEDGTKMELYVHNCSMQNETKICTGKFSYLIISSADDKKTLRGENCAYSTSPKISDCKEISMTEKYDNKTIKGEKCYTTDDITSCQDISINDNSNNFNYSKCNSTTTDSCKLANKNEYNTDYYYSQTINNKSGEIIEEYCSPNNISGMATCQSKGFSCQSETHNECVEWDEENWDNCLREEPYTEYYCN